MYHKILNRNTYIGIIGLISLIICIWYRLSPSKVSNFNTILSDTLSFASFITCLMFIGLAYLPTQKNSQLVQAMEDLRAKIVIMHQILITITIFFTICVVSIVALAITATQWLSILLSSLWCALLISGVLEVSSLLFELFRLIIYVAEEHSQQHKY